MRLSSSWHGSRAGFTYQEGALPLRELTVGVEQLLLAVVDRLRPALELGLARLELCAEGLLALGGADALGLDLLG